MLTGGLKPSLSPLKALQGLNDLSRGFSPQHPGSL